MGWKIEAWKKGKITRDTWLCRKPIWQEFCGRCQSLEKCLLHVYSVPLILGSFWSTGKNLVASWKELNCFIAKVLSWGNQFIWLLLLGIQMVVSSNKNGWKLFWIYNSCRQLSSCKPYNDSIVYTIIWFCYLSTPRWGNFIINV